jgi:DNA-binding response OmpR family regulator
MAPQLIALVDGDQIFLDLLSEWMRYEGYDTVCYLAIDHVLEVVAARQPDLIILDIGEGGAGLTALTELERDFEGQVPPIIAISAWTPETRAQWSRIDAWCQAFLQKPISLNLLVRRVHAIIGPPQEAA